MRAETENIDALVDDVTIERTISGNSFETKEALGRGEGTRCQARSAESLKGIDVDRSPRPSSARVLK